MNVGSGVRLSGFDPREEVGAVVWRRGAGLSGDKETGGGEMRLGSAGVRRRRRQGLVVVWDLAGDWGRWDHPEMQLGGGVGLGQK